jgi:hypothetical protein
MRFLKSKSTNYPDHGHHGDPPPTRKIPMVEPGIEPGTSWLVVRSSDHQTTRLVMSFHLTFTVSFAVSDDPLVRLHGQAN